MCSFHTEHVHINNDGNLTYTLVIMLTETQTVTDMFYRLIIYILADGTNYMM